MLDRSIPKLTQQELERHLWGAADILRGTVDAGDYKQYIFGLLFYKRLCDVWDEEFEALLAETGDRKERLPYRANAGSRFSASGVNTFDVKLFKG
jgi:type I restriction-modification system DNA methylase subunit